VNKAKTYKDIQYWRNLIIEREELSPKAKLLGLGGWG